MIILLLGMDKSGAAVCVFHLKGTCERGPSCPYRHIKADRTVVCKHWLRGLCKKGDLCEFLHEYDMSKMPECYFYTRFKACSNKECPFLHIDPETKIKDCPWYDRGFCRHGPSCRHRHTRRIICINYLCGFCPLGAECKHVHPRFDLPLPEMLGLNKKSSIVCHFCGEMGHKVAACPKVPAQEREEMNSMNSTNSHPIRSYANERIHRESMNYRDQLENREPGNREQQDDRKPHRPLDQVTCYKCGERGHYANKCPKGHLAFLSSALKGLNKTPPNGSMHTTAKGTN